jgi:hypothetical protein
MKAKFMPIYKGNAKIGREKRNCFHEGKAKFINMTNTTAVRQGER